MSVHPLWPPYCPRLTTHTNCQMAGTAPDHTCPSPVPSHCTTVPPAPCALICLRCLGQMAKKIWNERYYPASRLTAHAPDTVICRSGYPGLPASLQRDGEGNEPAANESAARNSTAAATWGYSSTLPVADVICPHPNTQCNL